MVAPRTVIPHRLGLTIALALMLGNAAFAGNAGATDDFDCYATAERMIAKLRTATEQDAARVVADMQSGFFDLLSPAEVQAVSQSATPALLAHIEKRLARDFPKVKVTDGKHRVRGCIGYQGKVICLWPAAGNVALVADFFADAASARPGGVPDRSWTINVAGSRQTPTAPVEFFAREKTRSAVNRLMSDQDFADTLGAEREKMTKPGHPAFDGIRLGYDPASNKISNASVSSPLTSGQAPPEVIISLALFERCRYALSPADR